MRLLAVTESNTAAWVQDLPVTNLDFAWTLDAGRCPGGNDTARVAVALCLGETVAEPHLCQVCQRPIDRRGRDRLPRAQSAGRFARHTNPNDAMRRALGNAALESLLEPTPAWTGETDADLMA